MRFMIVPDSKVHTALLGAVGAQFILGFFLGYSWESFITPIFWQLVLVVNLRLTCRKFYIP